MNAILLLLAFLPTKQVPVTRVDIIELNRYVDDCNKPIFDAYNFWTFQEVDVRHAYHVVDWRMAKDVNQYPEPCNGKWVLHWHDEKTRTQYRVIGRVFAPTISNFDPEVSDRDELPERYRRGLTGDPRNVGRVVSVLLRGGNGAATEAIPMVE